MSSIIEKYLTEYDVSEADKSLYVSNLDKNVDEEILWELFTQAGFVKKIKMPRDIRTNLHYGYAFIEFFKEQDAIYAIKLFFSLKLYNKTISVNRLRTDDKSSISNANIFIGNLSSDTSAKVVSNKKQIYDTFSAFGVITNAPKIYKSYTKKGIKFYCMLSYESFEASDSAIYAMNGQFFCGNIIVVTYSFKTNKIRFGTITERMLSENRKIFYNK
uniref:mRNA splicing factor 3b4 n=1 Tax=Amorphochlora amoebiformis TaxID=1561963 RepID=A0A0H5BIB2_9EUKA|nr:mRNA splicing factor 3b4 [Amorphochlora amoebiformis]